MSDAQLRSAPWFDFFPERFIAGTAIMDLSERGAYITLLCHQWLAGSLPDDKRLLSRLAGGDVADVVLEKFPVCADGKRRNDKLESVRSEQIDRMLKSKGRAQKAASARWSQECSSNAPSNAQAMPEHCTSIPQAVLEQCLPIPNTQYPITNTLIPHPSDEVSASPPAPVPEKRKRPKFQKPSQEEWVSYATSMPEPLTENQALGAWDHYEGNGWKVGRNPMADWRATLRAWSRRQKDYLPGYRTPALPLKLNLNPDDPRYIEITEKIGEKYEDIVQMPFVSSDEFHCKLQAFLATWHGSADLFLSVYGKALEFRDQQFASKEIRSASDPIYLCDNFAKVVSDVDWMQANIDRNSKPKTFTKGI